MAPLWLLVLLALAVPCWATWDTCEGTCGLRPMAEEFGSGAGAVPGAWPGLASIQDPRRAGSGHVCGGTLVTPGWVLTAARCFLRTGNVSTWRVVLGASDLSDPGPEAQVRQVRRLREHRELDVALLELERPVECSDYIQLGCVPEARLRPDELRACYVGGWGSIAGTAQAPREVLHEAQVRLLGPELCGSGGGARLCAEHSRGGSRTCQGDSGGPLVCRDSDSDQFWIVGVTSWGRGCVFTPTWRFSRWLLQQLGSSGAAPEAPETPGLDSPAAASPVLLRFFTVVRELLRFLRDAAG
ncbi:acrosin-like [Corvus moneduloides]|nr:acrosin-like [Corvus moneduloides]